MALDSNFKSYLNFNKISLAEKSVAAVLALHEEGATVPFISRYRKEKTGNLDEVKVRLVIDSFTSWSDLVKRKAFILEEVEKQGNLTPEFKKQIELSFDSAEIEELYRPFKRKKKTKAKMAKDAGLQPLADWIWELGSKDSSDVTLEVKAKDFINAEAGYKTYEEALRGAQHIIVEKLSNSTDLRKQVRDDYFENANLFSKVGKKYKTNSKYKMYTEFKESIKTLQTAKASHRYLALRRGWQEGELTVTIEGNDEALLKSFEMEALKNEKSPAANFLSTCAKTALSIHVVPSVVNELHSKIKALADGQAIEVFSSNVRRVLMSSPFGAKVVLGVDPGLKTGCKLALVNDKGKFISNTVLDILGKEAEANAKKLFEEVLKQIKIEVVAVGNGTGGREAEIFIRKVLKELGSETPVVLVNESGASVYSASDIAREEFPDLDLTVRGAISIARRLQDPLAELVKIDPKSIGVGQYQHDVSQTQLKKSLHEVVESCVNQVGVNLNTASASLLKYVAGIGPVTAKNIVQYREKNGLFKNRNDLMNVSQFSSKTFEQAAGFLRIPDSEVVLDQTGVHPERYSALREMAGELSLTVSQLIGESAEKLRPVKEKWAQLIGEFTFDDIIEELKKPGRDPRDIYKVFSFREDIHEIKDLETDMICPGVVTNVTNFGAFVDIGVHQDGLVHLSQISHEFVDDPKKVLSPGDQVKVKVLEADVERKQISLTMLLTEKPKVEKAKPKSKKKLSANRSGNKKGSKKPRGNQSGGNRKPQRREKPAFNNPFAALNDLKK